MGDRWTGRCCCVDAAPCNWRVIRAGSEEIHVDEVALYSVSPSWMADKITSIIEDVAGDHVVVSTDV